MSKRDLQEALSPSKSPAKPVKWLGEGSPKMNDAFFKTWHHWHSTGEGKNATICSTEHDEDWWRSNLPTSDQFDINKSLQHPTSIPGQARRKKTAEATVLKHHVHADGKVCRDPHCVFSKSKHRLKSRPPVSRATTAPGGERADPNIKVAAFDKGGGGAVIKPTWRKRVFTGLGGMPYHHEVLYSTRSKAKMQSGSCFVAPSKALGTG